MADEQTSLSSAAGREETEKRNKEEDIYVPPDAPIIPGRHLRIMKYLYRALDNPEKYELFKLVKTEGLTIGLKKAVREGNLSQLNWYTGKQNWDADISGIHSLKKLFNIVSSPGGRIEYIFGDQGAGKTDFAVLQAEFLHELMDVEIGTNIKSLADNHSHVEYINDYSDLKEWLTEAGRKFYILDEASSLLTGYYSDSGDVIDAFKDFVTKLRKNNSNIALIGHSGKDIHPLFRRLAVFFHKKSKKQVEVYRSATADESGRVEGHQKLLELNKIPASNWTFDTYEESTFTIETDAEAQYSLEEVEEMIDERLEQELREYRDGLIRATYEVLEDATYEDLEEIFTVSRGTVASALEV